MKKLLIGFVLLAYSLRVFAQCDVFVVGVAAIPPIDAFSQMAQRCYGSDEDQNAFVSNVNQMTYGENVEQNEQRQVLSGRLEAIIAELRKLDIANSGFTEAELNALEIALSLAKVRLSNDDYEDSIAPSRWVMLYESEQDQAPKLFVEAHSDLNLAAPIMQNCGTAPIQNFDQDASNNCKASINAARDLARILALTEGTFTLSRIESFNKLYAQEKLRLARWYAYRDNALPQFWWEWGLNSIFLERGKEERIEIDGVKQGRIPIPDSQLIFLHPGIGLQYTSVNEFRNNQPGNNPNSTVDPTLYVEVIGYNRWRWAEGTADMEDAMGVSIIGVLADRAEIDDFSYGLMFHYQNRYAISVTRDGDGNTGIMLNVDLSNLIRDKINTIPQ
jgi:hypothetical protein